MLIMSWEAGSILIKKSLNLSLINRNDMIIRKTILQPVYLNSTILWKNPVVLTVINKKTQKHLEKPREIKETFDKNGERRLMKIGDDVIAIK